jgi:hypothetical protein
MSVPELSCSRIRARKSSVNLLPGSSSFRASSAELTLVPTVIQYLLCYKDIVIVILILTVMLNRSQS